MKGRPTMSVQNQRILRPLILTIGIALVAAVVVAQATIWILS